MTLLSQYTEGVAGDNFSHQVTAAMWEKALSELSLLSFTSPPTVDEKRKARAIRDVLNASQDDLRGVVRLLISADINKNSADSTIQSAVSTNWDKIVLLFDPNLDA